MDQLKCREKKPKAKRSASTRRTGQTSVAFIVEGTSVPPRLPAQKKKQKLSGEGRVNGELWRLTTASESHLAALKLTSAATVHTALESRDPEKLLKPFTPQEKLLQNPTTDILQPRRKVKQRTAPESVFRRAPERALLAFLRPVLYRSTRRPNTKKCHFCPIILKHGQKSRMQAATRSTKPADNRRCGNGRISGRGTGYPALRLRTNSLCAVV